MVVEQSMKVSLCVLNIDTVFISTSKLNFSCYWRIYRRGCFIDRVGSSSFVIDIDATMKVASVCCVTVLISVPTMRKIVDSSIIVDGDI
jgi:hypothetical protein